MSHKRDEHKKEGDSLAEANKKWAKVIAKAWQDEKFKEKLLSHPNETLKEHGIIAPGHKTFRVIEERKNEICLTLPPAPPEGNLSEAELKNVAAAFSVTDGNWGPPEHSSSG